MELFYKEKVKHFNETIYYLFNSFIVVCVDSEKRTINGRIGYGLGINSKYFFGLKKDIYFGKNVLLSDAPLFSVELLAKPLYIRYYLRFKPKNNCSFLKRG